MQRSAGCTSSTRPARGVGAILRPAAGRGSRIYEAVGRQSRSRHRLSGAGAPLRRTGPAAPRVADLTREASPSPRLPKDLDLGGLPGDIDPQGLAALNGGRLPAGDSDASSSSSRGNSPTTSSGSDAEALISQIARQQLEIAFRQQHGAAEPDGRGHPLAAGAAAADSRSGAADDPLASPSEATDTEQLLQPLLPHKAPEAAAAPQQQQQQPQPAGGIPRSIVVLSCVSMALTSASCVFNTLLPIYMVAELKLTMKSLGMFEGLLEAFSYVVRMFSGVLSDRMASRKAAIAAGFAMGAAAKCGLSFAGTVGQLFVGKALDRLGNGVQAAPRDALIGDLSPAASRSACFGFAQAMRKWGSFMGAGLVFALMKATGNNYQAIFLGAAAVSALATLAFVAFVPSHPNAAAGAQQQQQPAAGQQKQQQQQQEGRGDLMTQARALWKDVRAMGPDFYRTLSVIGLYGLGHINESMLEARAIEVGFGKAEATLVVALLCLSVSFCAYPLGKLDDARGPRTTFALGMGALIAGDLVLLASNAWPPAVFVACVLWGVHWAVVQGPMLGVVVGLAPPHLKGTAFGIFYSLMAVTAVVANTMFGHVWHAYGATTAFGLSAAIISATLVLAMPRLLPARAARHGGGGGPAVAAAAA